MAPEPYVMCGGAAGGGKSAMGRWDLILAGLEVPMMPMLLLRRTLTELRDTHILTERGDGFSQLPASLGSWNGTEKVFTLPNKSYIRLGYCDNDKDIGQYLSTAWGRVFLDEGSQFTPWQVTMLDTRIRSSQGVRTSFRIGSNPGGPLHQYLRDRFIDQTGTRDGTPYDPEEWRFIPARLDDNPYLPPEYAAKLDKLPPQERAMYREGRWDLPMGNLFEELNVTTHQVPCDGNPMLKTRRVVCADWGWTAPAPALWVETDQGLQDAPYSRVYREWVPTKTIPAEWAKEVVRLSTRPDGEMEIEAVILDSAAFDPRQDGGPSMAEQMIPTFRKAGIRLVPSVKGPGSIERGVQLLHTYFWTNNGTLRPLLTIGSNCPQTWNALVTIQRGDATKGQDVDLPAPKQPQTHVADCLRYWCSSRPRPAEVSLEERVQLDAEYQNLAADPASQMMLWRQRKESAKFKGQVIVAKPVKIPKQRRTGWGR